VTSIIEDSSAIGIRLSEIEGKIEVRPSQAQRDEELCAACEGGGWECYGLGYCDPHFRECTVCGNPDGLPCP
jgi:hypothetical protein